MHLRFTHVPCYHRLTMEVEEGLRNRNRSDCDYITLIYEKEIVLVIRKSQEVMICFTNRFIIKF